MNDEKKAYIIMYLGWFIAIAVACYMFSRTNVSNNGTGTDNIREQISNSQNQQHIITEQVREAKQQVDDIRSVVTDTGNAIEDIEQILRGIRQRGKS